MAEVTSTTPAQPITIDASSDEWQSALTPIEDEDGLAMGVRNDAQDLYLTLVVTNESLIRQITTRGLTVWFDAEGGNDKQLGIEFPIGRVTSQRRGRGERPEDEAWSSQQDGGMRELPTPRTDRLALRYAPDEPGERYPIDSVTGVHVAASLETRTLVYELRVPLRSDGDFALGVAPGTEVGVGLETPEFERPDRSRPRLSPEGGVDRPGGGPPGEGSPPGEIGGRQPGESDGSSGDREKPSPPESLSKWMRVTLAEG